jgi:hypothetical protein
MSFNRLNGGLGLLFLSACGLVCGVVQHANPKSMDEWEALQLSLRGTKSIRPTNGFVPDEATAARIGEAVAVAQYGEKTIGLERPFRARLYIDTWIVKGTLHPEGAAGGTAIVKISKRDGTVLFLTHQY